MDERVAAWRRDTPGCERRAHLNNAGAALPPRPVHEAVVAHLDREAEIGGYEAEAEAAARIAATYELVGRLIGAEASSIAIVENATVAFAQALSAFAFAPGDVIVTTRADYPSNQLMYLSLAERLGVEALRAEDLPEGGADPESVRRLARHPRCRLVAVTWVPTNSGLVQPAEAIGEICEEVGVPYLVDACQVVGQLPVDVRRLRCDYLAATARKFLRGPRGIGFLYVAERAAARGDHPLFIDMRGADWVEADRFRLVPGARRFENWEYSYALVLGLAEAARYALAAGVEETWPRTRALAAHARARLAAIPGVEVLDRGRELCAIVMAAVDGRPAAEVVAALHGRDVNVHESSRLGAVYDQGGSTAGSVLRISPHYYNTMDEVDRMADALAELGAP